MSFKPTLTDLAALLAIVTHRSFRKAADELGVSPSTLSHVIRSLERNLGLRLLNRTTRSVSPTEAGERLVDRIRPILQALDAALVELDDQRARPGGTLRINSSEIAARLLLQSVVPTFLTRYPEVTLDLVTEGRLVDIVAEGFDAGIRLGESLPQDMVAVRFGGDTRFVAVASPTYVERQGKPHTPDDLMDHRCIRFRLPSGKVFHWEFSKHGQERTVDVPGTLILDHMELMIGAAASGMGIAYVSDRAAQAHLEAGRLISVLDDWCPPIPGLFLYYPGRRHVPASLRAFIEVMKEMN